MTVSCALILLCGHALLLEDAGAIPTDRELYTQASQAIATQQTSAAIEPLQTLIDRHANSSLAETAAFHLAECLWLDQHSEDALRILEDWWPRIAGDAKHALFATDLRNRTEHLLIQILSDLPLDDQAEAHLVQWFQTLDDAANTQFLSLRQEIAVEIARRLEAEQDFTSAQEWLRTAVDLTGEDPPQDLINHLHFELPLVWAEHERSRGRLDRGMEILEHSVASGIEHDQLVSVRFLLADYLIAAGKTGPANEQLAWLESAVRQMNPLPAWAPSLALRRSELLIASGQYAAAREMLLRERAELAGRSVADDGFDYRSEFEFLLARCAIARIDFASAIEHLQFIIEGPEIASDVGPEAFTSEGFTEETEARREAVARATWMLGEVHFLQRKYSSAISVYEQVVAMENVPTWRVRARLQSAKCYELTGQSGRALQIYQSIDVNDDLEASHTAAERIAALKSSTQNLR